MKRCVIVGGGPSKFDALNMLTEGAHLWTVGAAVPEYHSKSHTVFEMHKYDHFKKLGDNYQYVKDLKALDCRIMMQETHPAFPTAVAYPIQEIIQQYCGYLTNTISYMIALAIYEKYNEIVLVGVELDKEIYEKQRASIEYWLGVAWGSAIVVIMPDTLPFLKTDELYGYGIKL